jgi:predicted RNA-binding Zn-ribbon protein involved in translation (DUF1610 family)
MMKPFPPSDFVQDNSLVEGITVYKPAPVIADRQEIVDFHCPRCGATTAYSISAGGVSCVHCGYFEPPSQNIVGKRAQEFEFTVDNLERGATGWGEHRRDVECQSCGARLSIAPGSFTQKCPFCGSNKVVQLDASQDMIRPRHLIPFSITPEACLEITRKWMGSSWMIPAAVRDIVEPNSFFGIYAPHWTFDAITIANWDAEVGRSETENYYDQDSKEWKTRSVIVWKRETGSVQQKFDDLFVSGTDRLSKRLLAQINNYNVSKLVSYEASYLAGLYAKSYDISLEKAWEIGRQIMREQTRRACLQQASTQRVRNFRMELDFKNESWRFVLFPLYLTVYSFDRQKYQVVINGQNGSIAGQRPVDWRKIWLVIAAVLFPGAGLVFSGLLTLPLGGFGTILGGVGVLLLIIGGILDVVILAKANSLDDA